VFAKVLLSAFGTGNEDFCAGLQHSYAGIPQFEIFVNLANQKQNTISA
jgi:hypothetical protein